MAMPEVNGPSVAADEAAFTAAVAEATADTDRRQQQAAAFQDTRTPTGDVTAGQERLV
jgi:hypothetical protein